MGVGVSVGVEVADGSVGWEVGVSVEVDEAVWVGAGAVVEALAGLLRVGAASEGAPPVEQAPRLRAINKIKRSRRMQVTVRQHPNASQKQTPRNEPVRGAIGAIAPPEYNPL